MNPIRERNEVVSIEYLADHTRHVPLLADWHHQQWGYLSPGDTVEERASRLYARANKKMVPAAFVAIHQQQPVGSAILVKCDMDTRPALGPWLASVFVDSAFRERGIGTRLVDRVTHEAQLLGFNTLYLWTPDREAFYAKQGWSLTEKTVYRNENATIMSRPLS